MSAVVVMGVSAAGKSTVARGVADRLGRVYVDADDLHPRRNRRRMAAGRPLTDDDRRPWLDRVGRTLADVPDVVVACSALRRTYRDQLRAWAPDVRFVHVHADEVTLEFRLASREDHFMPPSLLKSQLATLEPLSADEDGIVIDADAPVGEVVTAAAEWVRTRD